AGHDAALDHELPEDIAASRAHRFADTDLHGPLGDAGQHDVHDDNSAHHHEDRDQPDGHRKDRARELGPGAHQGVGGVDAEGVVLAVGDVAAGAHEGADLVLQFQHVRPVGRLDKDQEFGPGHPDVAVGGERNDHEVVLALSKGAAHPLGHADHPEGQSGDGDFLFERVHVGEELVQDVLPDDTDAGAVDIVGIVHIAAVFDLFAADVDEAGGDGVDGNLVDEVTLVACGRVGNQIGHGPDVFIALQVVFQELQIIQADGLVAAARFEKRVEALGPLELVDDEGMGAEVSDVSGDVDVHAVDYRHDDDEGGGGD